MTNGIEVKLQRNALSVLEPPTGNEEDDDLDFENTQRNGSDMSKFGLLIFFKDSANLSITYITWFSLQWVTKWYIVLWT